MRPNNPPFPHPHNISFSCILLEKHLWLNPFSAYYVPSWGQLIIFQESEPKKCWLLSLKCLMGKSQVGSQHCLASPVYMSSQITVSTALQTSTTHHPFSFSGPVLVSCFTKEIKPISKYLFDLLTAKSFFILIPVCCFFLPIQRDTLSPWPLLHFSEHILWKHYPKKISIYYFHLLTSHSLLGLCF